MNVCKYTKTIKIPATDDFIIKNYEAVVQAIEEKLVNQTNAEIANILSDFKNIDKLWIKMDLKK